MQVQEDVSSSDRANYKQIHCVAAEMAYITTDCYFLMTAENLLGGVVIETLELYKRRRQHSDLSGLKAVSSLPGLQPVCVQFYRFQQRQHVM